MEQLVIPNQKFFSGDLVQVTKDRWPYLKVGMMGIITSARCYRVCVKGGIRYAPDGEGGPRYGMEWCYVCRFGNDSLQGVRLDKLSPVEVIIGER